MASVSNKVDRIVNRKVVKNKGILIILYASVYLHLLTILVENDICKSERTF